MILKKRVYNASSVINKKIECQILIKTNVFANKDSMRSTTNAMKNPIKENLILKNKHLCVIKISQWFIISLKMLFLVKRHLSINCLIQIKENGFALINISKLMGNA